MTTRTKICLKSSFVRFHQSRTKINMLLIIFRDLFFLSLPYTLNHTTEFLTWQVFFVFVWLRIYFTLYVCVCVGLCLYLFLCLYVDVIVCVQGREKRSLANGSPGAGITMNCELSDMGVGNQIQVFCLSSKQT